MVGAAALIYGILLPALVAGVLLLLGGRGTPIERRDKPLLGALALGIGYLVAHAALVGVPPVPFGDVQLPARDWIAWLVVLAIVTSPLRLVKSFDRWSGAFTVALLCVLSEHQIVKRHVPEGTVGTIARFACVVGYYSLWVGTERLSRRSSGLALPLALLVAGSGIAVSALLVHIASLAQLAGAVCAGLGAACVVSRLDRNFRLPVGAIAVAMVVFGGVLANAWIYDLPIGAVVLLLVSLAAPWVSELPVFASRSPTVRGLVAAACAALPAAAACWIAQQAGAASDYGGY